MKLHWTRGALADLDHSHEYVSATNPHAARDIIDQLEKAIAAVASYPHIGRTGRCPGTRELVITGTPFIVAYRVKKNMIEILAVIHHARAWPKTL